MSKTNKFSDIDFSGVNPEYVQRLITSLYGTYTDEKRDTQLSLITDRRQTERRQTNKSILLDTRTSHHRRHSSGRRHHDAKHRINHKVGIDYYI